MHHRPNIACVFLAAPLLLCLPARAGTGDDYKNVHTVAVVPAMGGDIAMRKSGHTMFGNVEYTLHADWNLDSQIAQQAAALLAGRFTVSGAAVDPAALEARVPSGFNGPRSGIEDWAKAQPRTKGIDAYVVIVPDSAPGTDATVRGASVGYALLALHDPVTTVTVDYQVVVVDARTGEHIDYGESRYPDSGTLSGYSPPIVHCGDVMWADKAEDLTAAQKANIRREIESLTGRSLGNALVHAGLIDEASAAAASRSAPQGEPSCHPFF